jgi:hypothetical protein
MSKENETSQTTAQCAIQNVVCSTFYLTSDKHYGDGQYYYNCNECGEQHCARTTEDIECHVCGHITKCIYVG